MSPSSTRCALSCLCVSSLRKEAELTEVDSRAAQVYIRGASVRFYVVPDMLAQAPMCVCAFPLAYRAPRALCRHGAHIVLVA